VTDRSVSFNRDQEPSSSLLARLQSEDHAAWHRLVYLYTPLVYGMCRRAGLQEADAQEVGQEVFAAVWRHIRDFRRDRPGDSFLKWLRMIVRNKVIDHHRRQSDYLRLKGASELPTRAQPTDVPDESDAEHTVEESNLLCRRALALIQSEFEEKTWRAFEAVVMYDRQPADVAKELQMSVNSVYLARSRILKRLREEFEGLIDW
jgi:RNA polymerase sigma-70 factor (ECF subfamily)